MSKKIVCYETYSVMFIKMTAKSKSSLGRLKLAQLAKIIFIVFRLASIIFTGKTSYLDMVYRSIALSLEPSVCREIRIPGEF